MRIDENTTPLTPSQGAAQAAVPTSGSATVLLAPAPAKHTHHSGSPQHVAAKDPDAGWRHFARAAHVDLKRASRALPHMQPATVVLGGTHGAPGSEVEKLAKALGTALADGDAPVRLFDRSGSNALAAALRAKNPDARLESVDLDGRQSLPAQLRFRAHTREVGKRIAMEKATSYVFLPGSQESAWELMATWAMMRVGLVPKRPMILVGGESFWKPLIAPLVKAGLPVSAIKADAESYLTYAESPAGAARLAHKAHADFAATTTASTTFFAKAKGDLERVVEVLPKFEFASVVLGGSGIKADHPEADLLRRVYKRAGVPVRTGGGPGVMLFPFEGAIASKYPRIEAICLKLNVEAANRLVDPDFARTSETLEIRQRAVFEKGSSYLFAAGGTGTWFELYNLWQMMLDGALPTRPIIVTEYYRPAVEAFIKVARAHGAFPPGAEKMVTITSNEDELVRIITGAYAEAKGRAASKSA